VNTKIGKQDCKKCAWYESCREFCGFKRKCRDYNPLNEDKRNQSQYMNDLNDRQEEYLDVMNEYSDCD